MDTLKEVAVAGTMSVKREVIEYMEYTEAVTACSVVAQ
jgi:hypothetical protein